MKRQFPWTCDFICVLICHMVLVVYVQLSIQVYCAYSVYLAVEGNAHLYLYIGCAIHMYICMLYKYDQFIFVCSQVEVMYISVCGGTRVCREFEWQLYKHLSEQPGMKILPLEVKPNIQNNTAFKTEKIRHGYSKMYWSVCRCRKGFICEI